MAYLDRQTIQFFSDGRRPRVRRDTIGPAYLDREFYMIVATCQKQLYFPETAFESANFDRLIKDMFAGEIEGVEHIIKMCPASGTCSIVDRLVAEAICDYSQRRFDTPHHELRLWLESYDCYEYYADSEILALRAEPDDVDRYDV